MQTLDPRLLGVFAALARTRNMTRAAVALGLSRSMVSRKLQQLEEDLGVRLVQRTTRRLSLTEVGEQVLAEAERLERALAGVVEVAAAHRGQVRGRLRVIAFEDLTVEDPGDRVRVIYAPTPTDIGAAMVDLAEVGSNDVVFEPGCGDARITIAAIRRGARRGLCVDIDPIETLWF